MPLFNQPLRLEKLSLHSFAKYLSDVCVCLVNSCHTSSSSFQEALAACERLRCFILDKIPHYMANSVISEALECLNSRYNDISNCIDGSSSCKSVLQHFVSAILHPQVTELDTSDIIMSIVYAVLNCIGTLSQLNIFRVCVNWMKGYDSLEHLFLQYLPSLKNLKCFTLPVWSTDEIISVLSKSAPGLTHLDVRESEKVTDKSINIILSFPHLQSLDVSETGISRSGYKHLLYRLKNCLHLQDIGLNVVGSSDLLLLPHCFQNLRRLRLNMDYIETKDLDDVAHLLQGLEELELGAFCLHSLPNFLTLKVLVLDVSDLEVKDLAESCPRLEKLMIKTERFECRIVTKPFAHLLSLSVCVIHTGTDDIDALLSATPNLVAFHFKTEGSSGIINIIDLFGKSSRLNGLQNLSVFSVNGYVDNKTLSLIVHKCLTFTCKVCGESREVMKRRQYEGCTKFKVNVMKWCAAHFHHL